MKYRNYDTERRVLFEKKIMLQNIKGLKANFIDSVETKNRPEAEKFFANSFKGY